MSDLDTTLFESRRRFLQGLAYRILGSLAEATTSRAPTPFVPWCSAA